MSALEHGGKITQLQVVPIAGLRECGRRFRMLVFRDRLTWFHMAPYAKILTMSGGAKVSRLLDKTCASKCGQLEEE